MFNVPTGAGYWFIQESQTYQSPLLDFWVKELIDESEMILRYIPSEELVADLLTKAVTGAKFKYLRAKLLGWNDEDVEKEA